VLHSYIAKLTLHGSQTPKRKEDNIEPQKNRQQQCNQHPSQILFIQTIIWISTPWRYVRPTKAQRRDTSLISSTISGTSLEQLIISCLRRHQITICQMSQKNLPSFLISHLPHYTNKFWGVMIAKHLKRHFTMEK